MSKQITLADLNRLFEKFDPETITIHIEIPHRHGRGLAVDHTLLVHEVGMELGDRAQIFIAPDYDVLNLI